LPQRTILSVAEEVGADPIFLGAEGMSGLVHAFIGSVSEEAPRHAKRTVLVVGGHPEDGGSGQENRETVNAIPTGENQRPAGAHDEKRWPSARSLRSSCEPAP
jgi:hypothetical protein